MATPLEALPESTWSPDSVTQWLNVSVSSKYNDNELGLQGDAGKMSSGYGGDCVCLHIETCGRLTPTRNDSNKQ